MGPMRTSDRGDGAAPTSFTALRPLRLCGEHPIGLFCEQAMFRRSAAQAGAFHAPYKLLRRGGAAIEIYPGLGFETVKVFI